MTVPGDRYHKGIDFSKSTESGGVSFAVLAAAAGRAARIVDVPDGLKDYGELVYIAHAKPDNEVRRYFTLYAHLAHGSVLPEIPPKKWSDIISAIAEDDFSGWACVERGTSLAMSGNSGYALGIHLHFEVHVGAFAKHAKRDPYDICATSGDYPQPFNPATKPCGAASLWTECPPVAPSVRGICQPSLCPGNALQFDGIDDEVVIPHSADLSFGPTDAMTVELWFKLTEPRSTYHLIGKRPVCGILNYQLAVSAGLIFFSSSGAGQVYTPFSSPLNTWVHIAGTYDGSAFHIYLDGKLKATMSGTLLNKNTAPLKIGQSGTCPSGQRFPGLIDEVRIS